MASELDHENFPGARLPHPGADHRELLLQVWVIFEVLTRRPRSGDFEAFFSEALQGLEALDVSVEPVLPYRSDIARRFGREILRSDIAARDVLAGEETQLAPTHPSPPL